MTLSARLRAEQTIFSAWSALPDSLTVEMVSGLGFGAVTLDMQHGGHHEDSVLRGIASIKGRGAHPVVRIPVGRFDMASRALDFGAEAVIAPMINSVGDARRFAEAIKYPPRGGRSWGPNFAMPRSGDTDQQAWLSGENDRTLGFAMIETGEALAALDDILSVDGIDGVLVGPSDFSIAWSKGRTVNPALEDMMPAIEEIAGKARAAAKHAAIYMVDPKLTGRFHTMGFRLFATGSEAAYMARGASHMLDEARASIDRQ